MHLRVLQEGVGVPVFDRGKKGPPGRARKIPACGFSRLLFFWFNCVTPMSQLGCFVIAAGQDFDEQVEAS
jgi:hypothetical protein